MLYDVELIVINKDSVRDPEGETLQRYVIEKYTKNVIETRVGKYVQFKIEANSEDEAKKLIEKIAIEGRLFNPIVHKILIRVKRE
ncbi:phosphoribosylformylglycinamidine synthase subunit PurS [Sulfolobus tengchongensis]|uniref:Phosphoribosylformylglycinamidine synthase subunit PurS n=1 Tax=Sulfolobus tengchongensis TaxID=207809 RepID=A0AAX4L0N8_9CREN